MAQGNGKFNKAGGRKKSIGSQRRKAVKVSKKKGKGSSKIETKNKAIVAATKQHAKVAWPRPVEAAEAAGVAIVGVPSSTES